MGEGVEWYMGERGVCGWCVGGVCVWVVCGWSVCVGVCVWSVCVCVWKWGRGINNIVCTNFQRRAALTASELL